MLGDRHQLDVGEAIAQRWQKPIGIGSLPALAGGEAVSDLVFDGKVRLGQPGAEQPLNTQGAHLHGGLVPLHQQFGLNGVGVPGAHDQTLLTLPFTTMGAQKAVRRGTAAFKQLVEVPQGNAVGKLRRPVTLDCCGGSGARVSPPWAWRGWPCWRWPWERTSRGVFATALGAAFGAFFGAAFAGVAAGFVALGLALADSGFAGFGAGAGFFAGIFAGTFTSTTGAGAFAGAFVVFTALAGLTGLLALAFLSLDFFFSRAMVWKAPVVRFG
jgi:hypothetical protein